jgi:hypothetical protein
MVRGALDACARAKLPAAVTYYLSTDEKPPMNVWIARYAAGLKSEYALVSHYPNSAQELIAPDEMVKVFTRFAREVDAPIIGWGEYGTEGCFKHPEITEETIIRQVEHDYWLRLRGVRKYAGLGGYWDWEKNEQLDKVFRDVWR